jgi:hypothetical protein
MLNEHIVNTIKNSLLIMLIFYCSGCLGSDEEQAPMSIRELVACVSDKPRAIDSPAVWRRYFDCFPGSYDLFDKVFGYQEVDGELKYAPLYHDSQIYIIEIFYGTKRYVGSEAFARKLIHLATTAPKWEADAPSALQYVIHSELQHDNSLYLALLSKMSDNEIRTFWNFLFDGPHGVHLEKTYCTKRAFLKACQVLVDMMKKN